MSGLFKYFGIDCTEPVRDPIWKNILLPREFMPIVASEGFTQLSRILQLGPAQLVYPGATHTRRAHSLGVFEMAKRILSSIAEKGLPDGLPAQEARAFLVAALCHDLEIGRAHV